MQAGNLPPLLVRTRFLLISLSLVAAACGAGADAATEPVTNPGPPAGATVTTATTTTTTTTTLPPTTTTTIDPGLFQPLTGLVGDGVDRQVLIVKMSNASAARPQRGINDADLVMEVIVEGGVGRWLAVFHTDYPEIVGPVRSLREVDPKLIAPFDARVLHSGGVSSVRRSIAEVASDEGDGRIAGYFREPGREYVYSLMYDATQLPDNNWDGEVLPLLDFDSRTPLGGLPADGIQVVMSGANQVGWDFDHGAYRRYQDGRDAVDAFGKPISADSVVVIFVETLDTGRKDSALAEVKDYQVTGTGDMVLFRGGQAFEGAWIRDTQEEFFRFVDLAGRPLSLPPGRTWIHVTPLEGTVSY